MSHPRIEEVSDSDMGSDPDIDDIDDFVDSDIIRAVPSGKAPATAAAAASSASTLPAHMLNPHSQVPTSTMPATADRSAYNSFQCLYPVYFDASRTRAEGRRVPSSLAVRNPLAREIANACSRLRLPTLLEPEKTHPQDWANPGRVKVGLKKVAGTGTGAGVGIKNKHHLYRLVAEHLVQNPTTEESAGLRVRIGGQLQPEAGTKYPRPAVPRGWKVNELVPYLSAAMTGGGVSENLFKDMMKEMQGGGAGGDPMSALMAAAGGGDSDGGAATGGAKKKKEKKAKARN